MNFHGGNIYDHNKDILDFSSNINPLGVPESFRNALLKNLEDFTKYPDIRYSGLKASIAEYLKLDSQDIIIPGNGAVEIIYKYMFCIAKGGYRKMICPMPTFSEYVRAAKHSDMEVVEMDIFGEAYESIDTEAIRANADDSTVVVLCNPNNPTGTLIDKQQLVKLAEQLEVKGSKLLIDEAFIEFTDHYPYTSMLDVMEKHNNVMLIRAVTKFFGMPGIRLGYGITYDKELSDNIKEAMEPWNINTAAVIAGCTVMADSQYIASTKVWLKAERSYLYEQLNSIEGIRAYKSNANFHLIEIINSKLDAWELRDRLIDKGILIRTPDGFKGLGPYSIRLAVKDRKSNDKLIKALIEIMEKMA